MPSDLTFKEIVTALLSFAIFALTGYMLVTLFLHGGGTDAEYQRSSGLLNVVIGFAGSVAGYYFGRVPAENRAAAAEANAKQSQDAAAHATADTAKVRGLVANLKASITGGPPSGGGDAAAAHAEIVAALDRILAG